MTTPWLPPELWKDIFAHATYFEGECDIHEWIQRTHPGSDEETKLELARRQIAGEESNRFMLLENPLFHDQQANMRLSLILVCRDWFQMTAEHFYRSILIRDPSKFHGCVKTLKKHPWICRFVRRLEFSIDEDDTDLLDSRSISAFQRQLTDVIEFCNELVFFRGSVSFEDARMLDLIDLSLRSALANHCRNLQLVVGHHALDGYPASTFFRHIPHLSNLVVLQLPPNVGTLAVTHKPPVSLPRLRILDLGNQAPLISIEFGRYLSRWDLPSLDAVHLGTLSPALALHSFWASHGSKLTTIKIYNAQKTTLGRRLAEVNLGITMPSNDLFPNIRQLIILHNPPRALTHLFLPSRSLEIYEVPFHSPWPDADAPLTLHLREQLWADHFRHLTPGNSPNLRTVRISSVPLETDEGPAAENWDGLWLDTWRKTFSDQGAKLEVVYRPT